MQSALRWTGGRDGEDGNDKVEQRMFKRKKKLVHVQDSGSNLESSRGSSTVRCKTLRGTSPHSATCTHQISLLDESIRRKRAGTTVTTTKPTRNNVQVQTNRPHSRRNSTTRPTFLRLAITRTRSEVGQERAQIHPSACTHGCITAAGETGKVKIAQI